MRGNAGNVRKPLYVYVFSLPKESTAKKRKVWHAALKEMEKISKRSS